MTLPAFLFALAYGWARRLYLRARWGRTTWGVRWHGNTIDQSTATAINTINSQLQRRVQREEFCLSEGTRQDLADMLWKNGL